MRWWGRLIRWAFERFYRQGAWTYDGVAWLVSQGHWVRWILAVRSHLAGAVLELGCGTGHLQAALPCAGVWLHAGLDLSPDMLRISKRRLRRLGRPLRLLRARGQQLPFPAASFDRVVATFPAEYILSPQTLREVWRVLRPGGQLLIVDLGQLPAGLYRALVELLYRLVFGRGATLQSPTSGSPQQLIDARLPPLQAAGFVLSERWKAVDASSVQILIAEKRDA